MLFSQIDCQGQRAGSGKDYSIVQLVSLADRNIKTYIFETILSAKTG